MRSFSIYTSLLFVPSLLASTIQGAAVGSNNFDARATSNSTACNNSPDLCSKQYNLITHLGAHDSPFVANQTNGYTSSANQYYNSTQQLDAGVRLLSSQMHYVSQTSSWHLCHSSCSLYDGGLLSDWLDSIKTWLDSNPNDVVTLLLVNSDNITPSALASIFQSVGLESYAFVPSFAGTASSQWPTLQSMINAGKRLVTFVPGITDVGSATYLLDEWTYIFENAYDVVQQSTNSCVGNFSCAVDRPSSVSTATTAISNGYMPLMNHLLYQNVGFGIQAPIPSCAASYNSPGSSASQLGGDASTCQTAWGRKPWGILVDYFNLGPAMATVDSLNGVSSPVGRSTVSASIPNTNAAISRHIDVAVLWITFGVLCSSMLLL